MLESLTCTVSIIRRTSWRELKFDVDAAQAQSIRSGLDYLEERIRHYQDVVTYYEMFLQRTRGIGVMTRSLAEVMGAVGPTARASNVPRDLRVPPCLYAAYSQFPVKMILDTRW